MVVAKAVVVTEVVLILPMTHFILKCNTPVSLSPVSRHGIVAEVQVVVVCIGR